MKFLLLVVLTFPASAFAEKQSKFLDQLITKPMQFKNCKCEENDKAYKKDCEFEEVTGGFELTEDKQAYRLETDGASTVFNQLTIYKNAPNNFKHKTSDKIPKSELTLETLRKGVADEKVFSRAETTLAFDKGKKVEYVSVVNKVENLGSGNLRLSHYFMRVTKLKGLDKNRQAKIVCEAKFVAKRAPWPDFGGETAKEEPKGSAPQSEQAPAESGNSSAELK